MQDSQIRLVETIQNIPCGAYNMTPVPNASRLPRDVVASAHNAVNDTSPRRSGYEWRGAFH